MHSSQEHREFDILALGDLNVDLIMGDLADRPKFGGEVLAGRLSMHAGGSTANFAVCSRQLGAKAALLANVGQDAFGDFLLSEMERLQIDTLFVARHPTLRTGVTVSLSRATDRAFVTHLGTIDSLTETDAPDDLLRRARHLHVGGYFLQSMLKPDLPLLFDRAHALGLTTSLDTGYDVGESWDSGLSAALAKTDLFLPNEIEAHGITGHEDPHEALAALTRLCPTVALKRGREGALLSMAGEVFSAPAYEVESVDTTCCGDAFNAGLVEALMRELPPLEALERANACGAIVAMAPGNSAEQLTPENIDRLVGGELAV